MEHTKRMRSFAQQVSDRASNLKDNGLANVFLSLGAYLEALSSELAAIHEEIHRVREELEKARLARQP